MTDENKTVSLSGSPILRHVTRERDFEFAVGSEDVELLERHIEQHLGPIDMVWHEVLSDLVHVDVHQIRATTERPFHWLVTTGMSDRPMSPPEAAAECLYAELVIALPATWPLSQESFEEEIHYWPIRLLKMLARLPHEYQTWLGGVTPFPTAIRLGPSLRVWASRGVSWLLQFELARTSSDVAYVMRKRCLSSRSYLSMQKR